MYREELEYIEYILTKPLWLKDHPEYNQHLNTIRPISWNEEAQVYKFKYDEDIEWDYIYSIFGYAYAGLQIPKGQITLDL